MLVLALICLPVFIGSLDLTIVSAFLPEILIGLGLPPQTMLDDAAWVVSGYLLAYAISMTFMGRVSDLIGRRAVYVGCLLVFVVGSVLVATAHLGPTDVLYTLMRRMGQRPEREVVTLLAIIIGRVVQALGAGALVPVSLALVSDLFPRERRAQPLGVVGAVDTLGWVLGHLYGGVLVNWFSHNALGVVSVLRSLGLNWPPPDWRTLFWINVPLALIGLAFTLWALRGVPSQRAAGRFDAPGALLIGVALVALVIGLGGQIDPSVSSGSLAPDTGAPTYNPAGLLIGAAAFAAFLWVEAHTRDPLLNLKLFRSRSLSAGAIINLLIGFCLMIGLVSVPILINIRIQDASKLSDAAFQAGVLLSALTVPMALAAVPGGWLSDRFGIRRTTLFGLALAVIGFGLMWQTWTLEIADAVIATEMVLIGVGIGLTFSPISASVINAASDDERGVASALVIILRLIGMTVAVASLTAFSIQRVSVLSAAALTANPTTDPNAITLLYTQMTARVLAELGLLGAVLCGLALLPALWGLPARRTEATAKG